MDYRGILSRHRAAVMGLMALLVIVYHARLETGFRLYDAVIGRHGSIAVDVFVFVAGFGLAFSLAKDGDLGRYMGRRLKRLLPSFYAFLLLSTAVNAIGRDADPVGYLLPRLVPVGTWLNYPFTRWYVSATLGYYVIAALIYPLLRRSRWLYLTAALLLALTAWYAPSISRMDNVVLAIVRVPALVAGLTAGVAAQRSEARYSSGVAALALLTLVGLGMFAFGAPLQAGPMRMLRGEAFLRVRQALLAPAFTALLALGFEGLSRIKLDSAVHAFSWLGGYSLELYLVHGMLSGLLERMSPSPPLTLLATVALSLPAAWLVQRMGEWLLRLWRAAQKRLTVV